MDNERTSNLWTERVAAFEAAAADARRRLQRRSAGWWRDEVAPGVTRADRVAGLVATLAALDPTGEGRGAPPRPARDQTLSDQLAVVAYDLTLPDASGADLDAALDAVATALRDVDPRR